VTEYPTAVVVGCHVWPAGSDVPLAVDPLVLDWGGPVGDRHHGLTMRSDVRQKPHYERGTEIRNHRQVSLVEETELDEVAAALGVDRLGPGLIADNIYLSGAVGLTTLPRMTRLVFPSGAVLMLGGENDPCTIAGALVEAVHGTPATAFPKAAIHKRGVTGWVEHPGEVRPGDTVEIRI
jgi:hypothetical protein